MPRRISPGLRSARRIEAGTCHAELRRKTPYGMREWVRCGCRRYTGPVPIEDFLSRPIMPVADQPIPRSTD